MDLDERIAQLYQLSPADFTPRRDELASQLKADGDSLAAKQVAALRKATAAAWLINALVGAGDDALAGLPALAEQFRDAHRNLDGSAMRELAKQRQHLVTTVTEHARSAATDAGQKASETVLRQVQETIEAAIADPAAGDAVLSGRLRSALSYSGFGEVDLTDAVVIPLRRPTRAKGAAASTGAAKSAPAAAPSAKQSRAAAELQAAEEAAAAAADRVQRARSARDHAQSEADEASDRVAELTAQLAAARDALRGHDKAIRSSKAEVDAAIRSQTRADQELQAARRRAES